MVNTTEYASQRVGRSISLFFVFVHFFFYSLIFFGLALPCILVNITAVHWNLSSTHLNNGIMHYVFDEEISLEADKQFFRDFFTT